MAKNMNFVPNFSVHNATGTTAAGTGAVNGATIDVANYDCVSAIVRLGTMADTATGNVRMQESNSNTGGWSDVANARVDFSHTNALDQANHSYVVELIKPTRRYARVVISRATANTQVLAGHYVLGGLRYTDGSPEFDHPATTHVASGVSGEDSDTHTSPGTAL